MKDYFLTPTPSLLNDLKGLSDRNPFLTIRRNLYLGCKKPGNVFLGSTEGIAPEHLEDVKSYRALLEMGTIIETDTSKPGEINERQLTAAEFLVTVAMSKRGAVHVESVSRFGICFLRGKATAREVQLS